MRSEDALDGGAPPAAARPTDREAAPAFLAGGGAMGALMRAHDWAATPLGPAEDWPQALRSALGICLNTRFPIAIYWGPELALLYNDAWSPIPAGKHPWALGRPAREVWPEIWDTIGPMFERVAATGEGTYSEDQLLPMHRRGFTEECYFNFTFSPIRGEDGSVAGIFNAVVETTYRVLDERRMRLLRTLTERASAARSAEQACALAAEAMAAATADVPFCLIYLLDGDGRRARLAAAAGLAPGGPAVVELDAAAAPLPFAAVVRTGRAELVADIAARLGAAPAAGPWPEPVGHALVAPVAAAARPGEPPAGFLVAGLSPRLAQDEGYRVFVERAAAQVAGAVANARAYEEERRRAEALAELDRAKTAFFANVSHEFRTPLTLMLGPLEESLAEAARLPPEERGRVGVAHRNALRLLRLVNGLLDFARVEAGRARARFEPTDLAGLTAELASSFRSLCESAGLRLEVDCPPLPAPVQVDREMWEKIVLNLLSNAFKFTFEGGIAVALRPSADGAAAELTVRDTGTGVPPQELPRLFERFHRVEGARGRSFEGSGIGLALVRELVRLHGGEVRVESEVGRGTAFTVAVPFGLTRPAAAAGPVGETPRAPPAPAAERARAYVEEARRWLADGGTPSDEAGPDVPPPPSAADDLLVQASPALPGGGGGGLADGGRVLLADDNADMRDYLRRLLAARGYEVEAAADGEAALEAARRRAPDLVLSDVMMPRLDGLGLLRALRAEPALAGVPVVLLSARAGEEARVEGLDAGADDYLTKPFSARELLARVGANLSLARVRREAAEAVRARSAELEAVLATVPAAVWFTRDADARRVWGNRRAAELLRLPPEGADASLTAPEGEQRPGGFRVFRGGAEAAPGTLPIRRAARGEEVRGDEIEIRFADDGGAPPVVLLCHATPLRDGGGRAAGAVCAALDITDRRRAEEALRRLNETLEARVAEAIAERNVLADMVESTDAFIQVADPHYRFLAINKASADEFERIFGVRPKVGDSMLDLLADRPEHRAAVQAVWGRALAGEEFTEIGAFGDPARDRRHYEMKFNVLRDRDGRPIGAYQFVRDVTERLRDQARLAEAEERLRQAQKMEAVGQLTGGVAHDFNNLLTVVTGNLATLLRHLPADAEGAGRLRRSAENALKGAQRAAALTHRLLAFSRRQPLDPKPLDVNKLVAGMSELLHRTLGETVAVETVLAAGLWRVEADPNQLESALLNLAVNARDAMTPGGGRLTVETANAHLDEAYAAAQSEVAPGQYVVVAVTDTGTGMPPEVLARAFEPFFTTKEVGQGTGLGLSQVYGFAKQSGGHVKIYSEPGEGTTVKLYLPRLHGGAAEEEAAAGGAPPVPEGRCGETILVVEDDADVRAYSVETLRELGYRVVEAPDGPSALRLLERGQPRVDLLFTDVVLPGGMTGRQLADAARARRPGLKVLFTTGYARNAIVHQGRLDPGVDLLPKPFTHAGLAARVRDVLDR